MSFTRALQAAKQFKQGVAKLNGLEVVGRPDMCVVAFRSTAPSLSIYAVNEAMSKRGWHLSTLQLPPALHICFTLQHTHVVDSLLKVTHASWHMLGGLWGSYVGFTCAVRHGCCESF